MAISTAPDLLGLGPAVAQAAAVATGASGQVDTGHVSEIRQSMGAYKLYFYPSAGGSTKKEKVHYNHY